MTAPAQRRAWIAKIAVVLVVVAMVVAAQQLGLFKQFADPAGAKQALVELGGWGYLGYLLVFALLQPFGFPAPVLILVAPLIWPWPIAFGLSLGGAMGASIVGFLFARFVARDWVARRIPRRMHRHYEALGRHAFVTVIVLRLTFWMASALHAFFGVSKVPFWTHFWGSLLAYVVPVLLISIFGEGLVDRLKEAPLELWIALGVAVVVAVIAVVVIRRRRRKRHAGSP